MNRSRLVVAASTFVVAVGALAAMGALYLDPARAAVGPLPAEGLVLPADAQFVAGIDVRRFVASPFYGRFSETTSASRPQAFAEMEEKTGINPERDVDAIYMAGRKGPGKGRDGDGVVVVVGTFDRYKVQRAIETAGKDVSTLNYQGTSMYLFNEGSGKRKAGAVAFLDDRSLVMGSRTSVEQAIAAKATGQSGVRGNAAMIALLETVRPGSTFWMVGDQSVLSQMPKGLPAPGGDGAEAGVSLPQLKTVVVTGDLDPVISIEATGEAADAGAAQNLADVVRGLVALASLQANQKPELKQLASAVSVTTDANKVHVQARFGYDLLDSLKAKKSAAVAAPTAQ